MKKRKGIVKKTGVIVPRVSLAYERSQILARVQDDLNVERVRIKQKRDKDRSRLVRRACPQCFASGGFKLMMPEWALEKHILNHRILRALGQEKEWVQELQNKYEERQSKFLKMAGVGRERANINRKIKTNIRSEWLWQRTILKPKIAQRRKIAWFTLKMGEPIWIVPVSVLSQSHKCNSPVELARAWDLCHTFVERLILISTDINKIPEKVILLVSGWFSVNDRKYISEICYVDEIINKEVILGSVLQFVRWKKR